MDGLFKIPGMGIPEFRMPTIPPNPLISTVEANYASEFSKRLMKWIADFDAGLDDTQEVGVRLVSFGQTIVFHLKDINYWNPSLISFTGYTEKSEPVNLIQHVSQISILLMSLPRNNPKEQKIGFHGETNST